MGLGALAESNFHRALQISNGSWAIFVKKPIALVFLIIIILLLVWTFLEEPIRRRRGYREKSSALS